MLSVPPIPTPQILFLGWTQCTVGAKGAQLLPPGTLLIPFPQPCTRAYESTASLPQGGTKSVFLISSPRGIRLKPEGSSDQIGPWLISPALSCFPGFSFPKSTPSQTSCAKSLPQALLLET